MSPALHQVPLVDVDEDVEDGARERLGQLVNRAIEIPRIWRQSSTSDMRRSLSAIRSCVVSDSSPMRLSSVR